MKTFNDLKKGDFVYSLDYDSHISKFQIYSICKYKNIFKFNFGKGLGYWRYDMHYINECYVDRWISDSSYIVNAINNEEYEQ